jgi:hypothetical protein
LPFVRRAEDRLEHAVASSPSATRVVNVVGRLVFAFLLLVGIACIVLIVRLLLFP